MKLGFDIFRISSFYFPVCFSQKEASSPHANGDHSDPRENGTLEKLGAPGHVGPISGAGSTSVKDRPPSRSGSSSARSTPSLKSKDVRSRG